MEDIFPGNIEVKKGHLDFTLTNWNDASRVYFFIYRKSGMWVRKIENGFISFLKNYKRR